MYKLLHRIFGEYFIVISCEDLLPFLKELTIRKIRFWSLCRMQGEWSLCTSLSDADFLLALAEEYGYETEKIEKRGLPFLLAKYKKRPGLVIGLLLGLFLIFFSELFVWKVEINGNNLLTDKEIIEALDEYGIGVGSYIPNIPVLQAQNDFLLKFKDLSSIAINIKGTHLEIELLERTHAPDLIDTSGTCNIVAAEDGIIVSVDVAEGTGIVFPGDVVEKGQLLISAYTVNERNVFYLRHARGKIMAHTYENFSVMIPLTKTVKQYTGKECQKTSYCVLGKEYDFFLKEDPGFERFDADISEKTIYLFGFAETPIQKTTATYREYRVRNVSITMEEAKAEAEEAFRIWLKERNDKVYDYRVSQVFDEIQNAYVMNVSVVLEKEIGTEMPVDPSEILP